MAVEAVNQAEKFCNPGDIVVSPTAWVHFKAHKSAISHQVCSDEKHVKVHVLVLHIVWSFYMYIHVYVHLNAIVMQRYQPLNFCSIFPNNSNIMIFNHKMMYYYIAEIVLKPNRCKFFSLQMPSHSHMLRLVHCIDLYVIMHVTPQAVVKRFSKCLFRCAKQYKRVGVSDFAWL